VAFDETDIPARQKETGSHTRISGTYGDESRTSRPEAPSRQGQGEAHAVIRHARITRVTVSKATTGNTTDGRFRRRSRITDETVYRRVFSKPTRSRDQMFTVLCTPNGIDEPRLGLAIGKKHCRLASGRNRLKRIVRESFRQNRDMLRGVDVVVLNQPAAATADNRQLFASLARHWRRCTATDKTS